MDSENKHSDRSRNSLPWIGVLKNYFKAKAIENYYL